MFLSIYHNKKCIKIHIYFCKGRQKLKVLHAISVLLMIYYLFTVSSSPIFSSQWTLILFVLFVFLVLVVLLRTVFISIFCPFCPLSLSISSLSSLSKSSLSSSSSLSMSSLSYSSYFPSHPYFYFNIPGRYIHCVKKLLKFAEEYGSLPLLANTMGWAQGLGCLLTTDVIRLIRPSTVVQLYSRSY